MTDFLTVIRDAMNPHDSITIKVPEKEEAASIERRAREIMERYDVVTWGWEVAATTVAFRAYEPHRYTARGRLKEAGLELKE